MIKVLLKEIAASKRIRDKMIANITTKKETAIILNLTEITYDFDNKKVTLTYYVEDPNYPAVEITFDEFLNILAAEGY
ncbi:hypothetical protein [Chitinophaga vietnamensis]|uniref:hypothetical protein n=1 Tax=Chitinophaga vietnamensis TaxID=2593957 RepID=UPI0011773642|nr:hypothetical protein [Chitinophaga vietnamensis]